ncbi:DUF5677 domain-containing protein [Bacillus sp. AFS051223]|uniref:DUF5677 domain-containing protein n=1 Tax=Bacillus sp. AFS051223 TaxID=2034280 RepID=UPI00211DF75B|nr:DUF5677 domain-containing protein [Bacillus sp. AFS051223]
MSLEGKLNELGSVIQKGEEAFDLSNEKFAQEFSVLPNEHAVAMLLFRKVIEKLDAIFILVDNGSEKSAESIARDLFENVLYLKFILNEEHFRRRALSYHYSYLKDKLSFAILISSNTQRGKGIRSYLNKDLPMGRIEQQKKQLRQTMNKPYFRNIKNEWDRLERKKEYPKWHSLFKGPKTIKELSVECGMEPIYHILYRSYSSQVHSMNAFGQIDEIGDGLVGLRDLRNNEDYYSILLTARSFGIGAIKAYIDFFSLEPHEEFSNWYKDNIEMMVR